MDDPTDADGARDGGERRRLGFDGSSYAHLAGDRGTRRAGDNDMRDNLKMRRGEERGRGNGKMGPLDAILLCTF